MDEEDDSFIDLLSAYIFIYVTEIVAESLSMLQDRFTK